MRLIAISILTVLLIFSECNAQNFLLLEKEGGTKRIKIKVGESLSYRAKGSSKTYKSKIASFKEDKILFKNGYIRLDELDEVMVRHEKSQGAATQIMVAGAGYFLLDQFNNSIIDGKSPSLNSGVNRAVGIIFGGGLLFYALSQKRIKFRKGKWKARIQYFDDLVE